MVKKLVLLSAPILGLIVPELWADTFEALRQSPYLIVYQAACAAWIVAVLIALVPWNRVVEWHASRIATPLSLALLSEVPRINLQANQFVRAYPWVERGRFIFLVRELIATNNTDEPMNVRARLGLLFQHTTWSIDADLQPPSVVTANPDVLQSPWFGSPVRLEPHTPRSGYLTFTVPVADVEFALDRELRGQRRPIQCALTFQSTSGSEIVSQETFGFIRPESLETGIKQIGASTPRRPNIEVSVAPALISKGSGAVPGAEIVVRNAGGPFTLVTQARLLGSSHVIDNYGAQRFAPRPVHGGDGLSTYAMATVERTGTNWLVKVRGENMAVLQRWEGFDDLWFDMEWCFYLETGSVLHQLTAVEVHAELSADRQRLEAQIKP